MSNSGFAARDAQIMNVLARSGLADKASDCYLQRVSPRGQSPVPCRVFLTRGVELEGNETRVSARVTTVRLLFADITTAPSTGDLLVVTGESFVIDSVIDEQESFVVCVVSPA